MPYEINQDKEYGYTRCLSAIGRKNRAELGPEYYEELLSMIDELQKDIMENPRKTDEKGNLEKKL